MECVSCPNQPDSTAVIVGLDVILPDVFCKLLCFFARDVCGLRFVFDGLIVVETVWVDCGIGGYGYSVGDVNVYYADLVLDGKVDVGLG